MTVLSPKPSTETAKLNDGSEIPYVALGCWKSSPEDAYNAVLTAIKAGYKHIDTAHIYQNEEGVGKAIRNCGVPREELFVTTKLWNTNHRDPLAALNDSLKRLGLDYVDLFLVHWPVPFKKPASDAEEQFFVKRKGDPTKFDNDYDWDFVKTWELVQKLPTSKCKSVGVSNMSVTNLKTLLNAPSTTKVPACNQVEMHPYLPQHALLKFCQEKGIQVEAYSPLGSTGSPLLKDETIVELSKELGISPATLVISWAVNRKVVVLPKSVTPSRIESNLSIVQLPDDVMEKISLIYKTHPQRILCRDWGVPVFNDEIEA
ncbi:unnamed protein product [Ambrosiozyma monospora]|uniref:Unnamed protein product n=1 Tax=Ambrosiozyma monospora TaxID=43982 RepID=A0ACB5SXU6_AMBMO|nr:unnamed protein product [Ambrosiozyma monospora]